MTTWLLLSLLTVLAAGQSPNCSEPAVGTKIDPNLKEIEWTFQGKSEKAVVWIPPHVTEFYFNMAPALDPVVPKHSGLAAKFVNLSNEPVRLYWEPYEGGAGSLMRHMAPFSASGTASFPGHRFYLTPEDNTDRILVRFLVTSYPNNIYAYDPYVVEGDEKKSQNTIEFLLSKDQQAQYTAWRKTLAFHDVYKHYTGRSYLSNYLRPPPLHYMWPADYFDQKHWVTSKETHFIELPPPELMTEIVEVGASRVAKEDAARPLAEYRTPVAALNFTLKVLSCQPRVFEIPEFLSDVEVAHILNIAGGENLKISTTGSVGPGEKVVDEGPRRTRTSYNSWVDRERSPMIDVIYRRSADVLRVDEALMRGRSMGEHDNVKSKMTMAESLQLVHYDPGQEYTAHHDFGYAKFEDSEDMQPTRFATLLFYLNDEGLVGGATSFPRYLNAESFEDLRVVPKKGKAILFYSQLPDGNMDDLSQHAAMPVREGEKWLINLWLWDPKFS